MYHGEPIVSKMTAVIKPWDETIPDCSCVLFLTESHLYVSEDNFDSTYTDHMTIALGDLLDIGIEKPYMTSIAETTDSSVGDGVVLETVKQRWKIKFGLSGSLNRKLNRALKMENGAKQGNPKEKFLAVHYKDSNGNPQVVYFSNYSSGSSQFIRKFNEIKQV